MTPGELDEFLRAEKTCRFASVDREGRPHNVPLWFVWDGKAIWLSSLVTSQRWRNLERDPRVSIVVDSGDTYGELRGVELSGSIEAVGEIPRTATEDPELATPERLIGEKYEKYLSGNHLPDGRHAWLRMTPEKIVSWDFRKIGG
jgi:PPOX class probable F420-dependent enzyme